MNYIVETVDEFFAKLNKMQGDLTKFSQNLDNRSEKIPVLLKNFEDQIFNANTTQKTGTNAVEKAAQKSLENMRAVFETWRDKIESDRKGKEFIKKNEKYLVVMIFGAVKAGKSSLGNFFAGKKFFNAPFDNYYKKISKPIFETEERGRDTGDIEKDSSGDTWFTEGVIDTTGAIQYFTLSGLRWIDSPGTGAVGKIGDTKNMTQLVEEYLAYTDMCIFLMNSSEPGLQDDMRYMLKLNKEGQDALIVITRSDVSKVKIDKETGKPVKKILPKDDARRKLQEDDICKRVKERYSEIDEQKFRAISVSTALANEAIEENDDEKFKSSNLDKLMKILGDKVSDNVIAKKQDNPRRLLNGFVDSIIDNLKDFDSNIDNILEQVEKYKSDMSRMSNLIVTSVRREVYNAVSDKVNEWNRQVKNGVKIDNSTINDEVSKILQEKLNEEINSQMHRVIEDFQNTEVRAVKANISSVALEKKTAQISHSYTESYTVPRPPRGLWEKFRNFFGKEYYRTEHSTRTEYQTVDLGTNIDEFVNSLMPQVESYAKSQADEYVSKLRDNYFAERETFAKNMRTEITKLRAELQSLKF